MNMEQLKQINQIQAITEQTVEALTEPIQPIYLMLKPEQYNLLAQHISQTGNAIVRNTDLISELPTQEGLDNLIRQTLRPSLTEMRNMAADKMDSMKYSVEDKLSKQAESMTKQLHTDICRMMNELKARDLTPWKLKLKWAAVGAILPSMVCILQLILQ